MGKNQSLFNPKKMGSTIIAAAIKKVNDQQSDKVVGQVQTIMERINILTLENNKITKQLELCRDQVRAIEEGSFTITEWNAQIHYNEMRLNIPWDQTGNW